MSNGAAVPSAEMRKTAREWLTKPRDIVMVGDAFTVAVDDLATLLDDVRDQEREACAAYCLDRDDQYETKSGTWVGIAECAEGIAKGDAAASLREGETEDLLKRVRQMAEFTRKTPKPKDRGDCQ